jgi:hypothetical protein
MENIFSIRKITSGIRMYATKDEKQRFYGKDKDYYISYNIYASKKKYVVSGIYSYAVLDMYGETLKAKYCSGVEEIDTSDKRAMYITISGRVDKLGNAMVLDAPISETGTNPSYIPHEDGSSGGGTPSTTTIITSFLAKNFNYDSAENTYKITSYSPNVLSYESLGNEFTAYVNEADHLKANSSIDLFGHKFSIQHINQEPLTTTIESVASVMPFLCSKDTMTARMLYSYVSTSQTGLGLEDLFLDVEDTPFEK